MSEKVKTISYVAAKSPPKIPSGASAKASKLKCVAQKGSKIIFIYKAVVNPIEKTKNELRSTRIGVKILFDI